MLFKGIHEVLNIYMLRSYSWNYRALYLMLSQFSPVAFNHPSFLLVFAWTATMSNITESLPRTYKYNLHLQDIIEQSEKGEIILQRIGEQTIIQYLIETMAKLMATKDDIYEEVNKL